MKLTEKQQLAVDIRNKNILVSAAAGSGKTAVLVKRIIDRILNDENPIDIDKILVMTFTQAAAAQMKERILKAIEEKRSEKPFDKNLQKQASLVHSANISTIDSFCMNVVRNHFSEIDLNPDFRIADEGECNLIKRDALDEVLEELFKEGNEEFFNMTETFASGKSDSLIDELILKLHTFSESYVDPDEWLLCCTELYSSINLDIFDKTEWVTGYTEIVLKQLTEVKKSLQNALYICCYTQNGPAPYEEAIQSDIEYIDGILNKKAYSEIYKCIEEQGVYEGKRLGAYRLPKEGTVPYEELEEKTLLSKKVKEIREKAKDIIKEITGVIYENSPESICSSMHKMYSPVKELVAATRAFKVRFAEKKREKNVVDFNDVEHMCLEILRTSENAAKEYRELFDEIYVDEYQDSNLVQEEILSHLTKESENTGNLFMVGDVKQSIYGFRLARPDIFIGKYNRFPSKLSDSPDIKIDLHDNFRSRKTVINSVNEVFYKIMTEDSGKIIYDDNAALHAGAEYDELSGFDTELIVYEKDEDVKDRELEAEAVASRIKSIVGNLYIKDEDETRPARYSDIVLLLRTAKGWDNVFMNVLKAEGIPVHVTSSTGYFSQREVATLLEYLKVIDNPRQDVALVATMRSILGGFCDEEVASIRGAFPEGSMYDSLYTYFETYKDNGNFSQIIAKISNFTDEINYFRNKMTYVSVDNIISEIIDGYYGQSVRAEKNGDRKFANLNILLNKAVEFGKTSYKGLFHFNRYIEMLHKYEVDFGEANILDENDDAVRIMSIHKSKGLEFPVCFICGMNKQFNVRDASDSVIPDPDWGIGVDIIDPVRRTKSICLFKKFLSMKKRNEILEEEIRLFYVAMTRAKEKLIMTAVAKTETLENPSVMLTKASSYLDLIRYATMDSPLFSITTIIKSVEDLVDESVNEAVNNESDRERISKILGSKVEELPESIRERIEFIYPYKDEKNTTKLSVSEIKRRQNHIEEDKDDNSNAIKERKLISDDNNSSAKRGTAIHRIFEIWDYSLSSEKSSVENFVSEAISKKLIDSELADLVDTDVIYEFVNSDIAKRIKEADETGSLWREQPFVIEDDVEKCLVQGIIDAYFIENNEIVLVDYKTDRVNSPEILVNRYRVQLDYYAKALEMLLDLKVKEKVIYSTCLKQSITM